MPGLRERIAEALDAFFAADVTTWNIEELADAVMVEVQRDLDEAQESFDQAWESYQDLGALMGEEKALLARAEAAEADAARLAEALAFYAEGIGPESEDQVARARTVPHKRRRVGWRRFVRSPSRSRRGRSRN